MRRLLFTSVIYVQSCSFLERVRLLEQEQARCLASKGITCVVRVQLYIQIITIDCFVSYTPFMMQTVHVTYVY